MSTAKPLSAVTLSQEELKADRKTIKKYDQCGLGEKAIYMGSNMLPRAFYVPYSQVTHLYKRVASSEGTGKAFLTPVLYLVVRYDDGKETQCLFRYLKDADEMMNELERTHPSIRLVSPRSEVEAAERKKKEEELEQVVLSDEAAHAVRKLEMAKEVLHKRPGLYQDLAGRARIKRKCDLIKPGYQVLAGLLLLAGILTMLLATVGMNLWQLNRMTALVLIIAGAALAFMMINSKILPTPDRNRKSAGKNYEKVLAEMQHHINGHAGFALPARYAHPVVCDRMIRILREKRAESVGEALEVLKEDLKKADKSVQLSRKEYEEVVAIKSLFTVCDYE